ncbi:MAG TPA: AMP-binding protein [Gaiellales bacterium]|nr:AMP-binding protein [Gaiellales bacterium]
MSSPSLQSGLLRSAAQHPDRPCLRWGEGELTHAEMAERAGGVAAAIGDCPRVAILADRTPTAFAGVLGALVAGRRTCP